MDQIKTGRFLQQLRKEKGLTQEQFAERFGVARRTVSRWETGSNMPDLDLLIEMSDYYAVDLRELLNGERTENKMNRELEETVLQVAEYSSEEKKRSAKTVIFYFVLGILSLAVNTVMTLTELGGDSFWAFFVRGATTGIALGAMILGLLYVTGRLSKVCAFKKRLLGRQQAAE